MDVAITGSTGLIGSALGAALESAGHTAIPVTRSGGKGVGWDPAQGKIDAEGFEGVDAVIHLAGEGIGDRRWNNEVKARIRDSRVNGTDLLARTLSGLQRPPKVLLSASAIGYYGDRGDEVLTEESSKGTGFLSDVVAEWEAATGPAREAGIRTCLLRTGLVLTPNGGALAKMLPLFKARVGGKMGGGTQYWSWISLDDHLALTQWLLSADVAGPVNLTGPAPTTNTEFTKTLGRVISRPTAVAVPKFGPKALLGAELATALLFTSTRAVPAVATDNGFEFSHPTLEVALRSLLAK